MKHASVSKFSKRILDLVCGSVAWFLLAPFLVTIATLIRFNLGAPIFFKQSRPGLSGKPFNLYKFRTMNDARDNNGKLLPDADRLTPLGGFLRATSFDELPELLNIIRGDMSLVGPRPLLMQYLGRYTKDQARRHDVKPGLTGWAQVNGRNSLSWEEKFKLDVWYVDNQSIVLDVRIILMTVKQVLLRTGITHQGEATMHEFMGNSNIQI